MGEWWRALAEFGEKCINNTLCPNELKKLVENTILNELNFIRQNARIVEKTKKLTQRYKVLEWDNSPYLR